MFEVVVFLACRRASPEGPRGPGATLRLPFTLEGVSYTFRFDDPATEMWPQRIPDLYAGEPVIVAVRFSKPSGRVIASASRSDPVRRAHDHAILQGMSASSSK